MQPQVGREALYEGEWRRIGLVVDFGPEGNLVVLDGSPRTVLADSDLEGVREASDVHPA